MSSSFGSPSPFIMSPLKKISKKTQNICTALEQSKHLQAYLNTDNGNTPSTSFDNKKKKPALQPNLATSGPLKLNVPMIRSFHKSIIRDVDVSVFAELKSPLELESGHVYSNNYTTLKVTGKKEIRQVNLRVDGKDFIQIPVLELKAQDVGERFQVEHSKGVFDKPEVKQASKNQLSIYLFGTYARRSAELLKSDDILGIVNFRTVAKPTPRTSSPNLRKRPSEEGEGDGENTFVYPYSIVVDSLTDLQMISASTANGSCKEEKDDDEDELVVYDHELCQMFDQKHDEAEETALRGDKWAPFLSFCEHYQAPDNPKEMNQSLYIFQPCVPKFESASTTVKM